MQTPLLCVWLRSLPRDRRSALARALVALARRNRDDADTFLSEVCATWHGLTVEELRSLVPSLSAECRRYRERVARRRRAT